MSLSIQDRKRLKAIFLHVILWSVFASLVALIALPYRDTISAYNIALLYQGLVTYVTGAMIALFLAVFNSNSAGAQALRQTIHARSLYYMLLFDLLMVVGSGVVIIPTNQVWGSFLSMIAFIIMTVFSLSATRLVGKLIKIGI